MKYPAHIYAKALAAIIADAEKRDVKDQDRIVQNFIALVRKNGDEPHIRKLVEEAARMARGKAGLRKVTVESARPLGAAQRKTVGRFMKAGDIVEEEVDPELVAGMRIIINDEMQFDGSLKGKLDKLFGAL